MTLQIHPSSQQPEPILDTASDAALYARAEQHIAAGDWHTACGLLLRLVESGCEDWQPYNDLGVIARNQNDIPTAIHFLREAVRREAVTGAAQTNLNSVLLMAGRTAEAAEAWGEALGRNSLSESDPALHDFLSLHMQDKTIFPAFIAAVRRSWQDNVTTSLEPISHPQFLPIRRFGSLPHLREVFPEEVLPPVTTEFFFSHTTPAAAPRFAAIKQYEIADAVVRPFSDVVQQGKVVLVPDFFELDHHMLYDTFTGYVIPLPGKTQAAVRDSTATKHLQSGVVLTSYAVSNWAHFLTEVLPLVAVTEHVGIAEDVPLVLSEGILPQMLQMISMVKAPQRQVVLVREATRIGRAAVFTPVTTVVYDYVDASGNQVPSFTAQDTLFSAASLRLTTRRLQVSEGSKQQGNSKIFIDRESPVRRIRNKPEVLQFFRRLGYHVVAPETLSAREQLQIFSCASVIAGPAGAGMANMMLAPSGCRVITLAPATPYGAYGYFSNMAASFGHQLYSFGFEPAPGNYHSPAHADFTVDLAMLAAKLPLIA